MSKNKRRFFKVDIAGQSNNTNSDDGSEIEDEIDEQIDEEINTDREGDTAHKGLLGDGLTNSAGGYGITVSQSLGIGPSVDSLALDEYDHIETVGN